VFGPDHPAVATSLNNVAKLRATRGEYEKAEALYRRALATWEETLGPAPPDMAACLENLAALYRATGRVEEAEGVERRAARIWAASAAQNGRALPGADAYSSAVREAE
jgi:tetratricopeptide (TPR) repeat protein